MSRPERVATNAEDSLKARDAHSSAIALAVLSAAAQPFAFLGGRGLPRMLPLGLLLGTAMASLLIAAYLFATRARPNRNVALVVGGLYTVFYSVLIAYAAARARALGRAYEAFVLPQLLITSFGLVVPGFRLGAAALTLFVAQSIGVFVWLRAVHTPIAQIPISEPGGIVACTIAGVGLFVVRYRRNELALRYVRASAEILALARLSQAFASIVRALDCQLEIVADCTQRLRGAAPATIDRSRRAVERLGALRSRLRALGSSPAPDTCDTQKQFHASEARAAAIIMSAMAVLVSAAGFIMLNHAVSTETVVVSIALGLLGLVSCAALLAMRQPSERLSIAVALLVTLGFTTLPFLTTPEFIRTGRAWEPLLAHKILALLLPLAVGRHVWLGIALEGALMSEAALLYVALGLAALPGRIPVFEPWLTFVYAVIGVGLLLASEHRRVALAHALQADRELSAQARCVGLQLAVLDQLGSPLQTLVAGVSILRAVAPKDDETRRMSAAVKALTTLRNRIPPIDEREKALVGPSFDAASVLRVEGGP